MTGNISQDEPKFTDLEPTKAGNSGDGYLWKYLFTISKSFPRSFLGKVMRFI